MRRTLSELDGPIERAVQRTGGSTFTVSLPKPWAQAQEIESGDSIYLYPLQDRLVLASVEQDESVTTGTIDAGGIDPGVLRRRIATAYATGADEIVVHAADGLSGDHRRAATETITDLIGMEIATEIDSRLVFRNLLDPTEISLEQTGSQLRQLALSMHADAVRAVTSDDESLADHVVRRDDDADRLFALLARQFDRLLVDVHEIDRIDVDRQTAFTQVRTARQLERVADHAERIALVAHRQDGAPEPSIADRIDELATEARAVVETALDGEPVEALARRDEVVERIDTLDRELYQHDDPDAYLYGSVVSSVRRTADYGGNVADTITGETSR